MKALLTVATLLAVGCVHTTKTQGPPSACADDLLQGGYVDGRDPQPAAETYCAQYNQGQLAVAKDLFDKHYQDNFGTALAMAKQYHPAEIACAKRETDTARADNPQAAFAVSEACQGATFHTAAPVEAGPVAPVEPKTNNLLDALTNEGHCGKFIAAVEKVNLTALLKTGGPWTVLAPTNRAVNNMPGGFEALIKKPEQLKRFVRAHLVDGRRPSSDIKAGGVKWPTADGRSVVVEKKGQITLDKTSHVIKAEIPADNGLVYTIDKVLEP